jgi:uncharacterized membrane protein
MDVDWLAVLFRWIHILTAVIAVGGVLFQRLVLMPAISGTLDEGQRVKVHEAVVGRWKTVLMTCIGLLLVSGFWNFFTISLDKAKTAPAYHGLFGLKFLAALAVFFLGSVLTGKAKAFQTMRDRRAYWLGVTAVLAVLVILVSGILKNLG